MINLLPTKEKEKIYQETNKKIAIVLEIAIVFNLFFLVLVLLAVNFYILGESVLQKYMLEQDQKEYQTQDFLTYKDGLEKFNKNLVQLKSFYESDANLSEALKIVLQINRPGNLYFKSLVLDKNLKTGKITTSISGVSDTRENLLAFQDNLAHVEKIKNVSFSPESWINAKNVSFSLTLDIIQ